MGVRFPEQFSRVSLKAQISNEDIVYIVGTCVNSGLNPETLFISTLCNDLYNNFQRIFASFLQRVQPTSSSLF